MTAPDPLTDTYDDDDFIVHDRLADGRASARMLGIALLALVGLIVAGLLAAMGLWWAADHSPAVFWSVLGGFAVGACGVQIAWTVRDRRARRGGAV